MSTAQQVIATIDGHMKKYPGKANSAWYVGIAADPRARLFTDHKVDEKSGIWVFATADTNAIARQVETAYHNAGCKGGPGGGDASTKAVYAYVITSTTVEDT